MSIDVGIEFHPRLANRDRFQGDGRYTAVEFRKRYLKELDRQSAWTDDALFIVFDFKNVKRLGPSFANEAFAYFTKFTKPKIILRKISFVNISRGKRILLENELDAGYSQI